MRSPSFLGRLAETSPCLGTVDPRRTLGQSSASCIFARFRSPSPSRRLAHPGSNFGALGRTQISADLGPDFRTLGRAQISADLGARLCCPDASPVLRAHFGAVLRASHNTRRAFAAVGHVRQIPTTTASVRNPPALGDRQVGTLTDIQNDDDRHTAVTCEFAQPASSVRLVSIGRNVQMHARSRHASAGLPDVADQETARVDQSVNDVSHCLVNAFRSPSYSEVLL